MLKVIEHHSASSGNTFIDCPHMWIIDKLYEFESEPNARMKMGLAAEDAAHYGLIKQINDEDNIKDTAIVKYLDDYQGEENEDENLEVTQGDTSADDFTDEVEHTPY